MNILHRKKKPTSKIGAIQSDNVKMLKHIFMWLHGKISILWRLSQYRQFNLYQYPPTKKKKKRTTNKQKIWNCKCVLQMRQKKIIFFLFLLLFFSINLVDSRLRTVITKKHLSQNSTTYEFENRIFYVNILSTELTNSEK